MELRLLTVHDEMAFLDLTDIGCPDGSAWGAERRVEKEIPGQLCRSRGDHIVKGHSPCSPRADAGEHVLRFAPRLEVGGLDHRHEAVAARGGIRPPCVIGCCVEEAGVGKGEVGGLVDDALLQFDVVGGLVGGGRI